MDEWQGQAAGKGEKIVIAECGYTMEELVPLVGELAGSYAGYESSSISYEKAQQLMKAVLYCIQEAQEMPAGSQRKEVRNVEKNSAKQTYRIGLDLVKKKVSGALQLFNTITEDFYSAGNRVLEDTVLKGMPAFFQYYDAQYAPQDTILTLDYPVLNDLSACSGIDAIYEYLRCIELEQHFLKESDEQMVLAALERRGFGDPMQIGNLCEAVLEDRIYTSLQGGKRTEEEREYFHAQLLAHLQKTFPQTELTAYLEIAISGILYRYSCMTD